MPQKIILLNIQVRIHFSSIRKRWLMIACHVLLIHRIIFFKCWTTHISRLAKFMSCQLEVVDEVNSFVKSPKIVGVPQALKTEARSVIRWYLQLFYGVSCASRQILKTTSLTSISRTSGVPGKAGKLVMIPKGHAWMDFTSSTKDFLIGT